eukprot:1984334-Amphidinium_carterae.1
MLEDFLEIFIILKICQVSGFGMIPSRSLPWVPFSVLTIVPELSPFRGYPKGSAKGHLLRLCLWTSAIFMALPHA